MKVGEKYLYHDTGRIVTITEIKCGIGVTKKISIIKYEPDIMYGKNKSGSMGSVAFQWYLDRGYMTKVDKIVDFKVGDKFRHTVVGWAGPDTVLTIIGINWKQMFIKYRANLKDGSLFTRFVEIDTFRDLLRKKHLVPIGQDTIGSECKHINRIPYYGSHLFKPQAWDCPDCGAKDVGELTNES